MYIDSKIWVWFGISTSPCYYYSCVPEYRVFFTFTAFAQNLRSCIFNISIPLKSRHGWTKSTTKLKNPPFSAIWILREPSETNKEAWFKGALSSLRQILATESLLKLMKNAFYFTLKALLILKIFQFLSWIFGHVEKHLD